jgi:hypothetical protein
MQVPLVVWKCAERQVHGHQDTYCLDCWRKNCSRQNIPSVLPALGGGLPISGNHSLHTLWQLPYCFRIMWYQAYAFAVLSGFYLAEMTVDRLIVVRFPMAAPRLCTTRRACVTITVTFILICGLHLYIFFTFRYVQNEETGKICHWWDCKKGTEITSCSTCSCMFMYIQYMHVRIFSLTFLSFSHILQFQILKFSHSLRRCNYSLSVNTTGFSSLKRSNPFINDVISRSLRRASKSSYDRAIKVYYMYVYSKIFVFRDCVQEHHKISENLYLYILAWYPLFQPYLNPRRYLNPTTISDRI